MRHTIRHVLPVAATLVALAGCGGSGPAAAGAPAQTAPTVNRFRYGPFRATYVAASHGSVEQMGQSMQFEVRYFLTASATAAGGASRLSMTVDSVPVLSGQGTTSADAAAAAGVTFTGLLSPDGEIVSFEGAEDVTSAFVQQLRSGFERFFPRVPGNGAATGETWTDSLHTTTGGEGIEIAVETEVNSEAVDWVEWDGVRALHVIRTSTYTLSGSGSQMGTEFTVDGTGVRHEHRYLGADGTYLGGTTADTSNAVALVTSMGMEIPIQQIQSDTLRIVR